VETLDPYQEWTTVADGPRALINPGKVLENLFERMERLDLDPENTWSPDELMSEDEMKLMFLQLHFGQMVVAQTGWYARRILARWPLQLVEHPIVPEARLEMFIDVQMDHRLEDIGRRVLNRALASPGEVESHPELEELSADDLLGAWLAVVFWFGVKSGSLHRRASSA
jgi:hypothetical protein